MDLPVIKSTNPYGIPEDILNNARAQREDNPFDIRKEGVAGFLMKALGLLGTATGNRGGVLKQAPKLPKVEHAPTITGGMDPGVGFPGHMHYNGVPREWSAYDMAMDKGFGHIKKDFGGVRPGQGMEVPGNLNTPKAPVLPKQDQSHTAGMLVDSMANMPGVRPAHSPLGSPQPKNFVTEYLLGPNEGKGNFGTSDWMNMKPVANDSPLKTLKGLTQAEKYELVLQDQQLKKMGHDPNRLSSMEKLQLLFPDLFKD